MYLVIAKRESDKKFVLCDASGAYAEASVPVKVQTNNGDTYIATCMCDAFFASEIATEEVMSAFYAEAPLPKIIGYYTYQEIKAKDIENNDEKTKEN